MSIWICNVNYWLAFSIKKLLLRWTCYCCCIRASIWWCVCACICIWCICIAVSIGVWVYLILWVNNWCIVVIIILIIIRSCCCWWCYCGDNICRIASGAHNRAVSFCCTVCRSSWAFLTLISSKISKWSTRRTSFAFWQILICIRGR